MKTFVLDTNIILFDPTSIFHFAEHKVFIPLVVIEEVDRFKRDQNENGRNARHFSRIIDDLRKEGSLCEGVSLEQGGLLVIAPNLVPDDEYFQEIDLSQNDNLILASALRLKEEGDHVVLVTKDINLRLKSDILGIRAEDYGKKDVTFDQLYAGHRVVRAEEEALREFEEKRFLPLDDLDLIEGILANEYVIMQLENNERRRMLGRYCVQKGGIVPLVTLREGVWGIYPKNIEQHFALDALLNDEINFVTLMGKAGTGKTLLAIAAGLEMTISKETYGRLLVSRPIQPMGKDLGFLPGDVNEKLGPWMQPIFDNMDFLFGHYSKDSSSYEDLINNGLLHIEPLTYIRGRSIPGQYLIVDEAQNLSPHEVKTIVTRAAEGTKIVLTGDCYQIDSPYLDEVNNGLAYCAERLKGEEIVAHTLLKTGERSHLSEVASKLL